MDNQSVTYTELNLTKNPKRQRIIPRDTDNSISIDEQEITYAELNLHTASQNLQNNDKNFHCKGKLLAEILGVVCIVLMAGVITVTVLITTPHKFQKDSIDAREVNGTQKANHCEPCPEDWLSYSNNCYYFSNDKKNWTESQTACASKKSNLINIDNEEEMKFLPSSSWIGLFHEISHNSWFWTNGSHLKQKITEPQQNHKEHCAMLFSSILQSAFCGDEKKYICKQKILKSNI